MSTTLSGLTEAGLSSVLLGEVTSSVYCAPSHPASRLARLTEHDLATLPFFDYPVGELHFLRIMRDADRQRVAYLPTMELALQMSTRGKALVCVPDFMARAAGPKLVRLICELPRARLHLWFRRPIEGARPPALIEHLLAQKVFSELVEPTPRPATERRRTKAKRARSSKSP